MDLGYDRVFWFLWLRNLIRPRGLDVCGSECSTIVLSESIWHRIRYYHRVCICPVQNTVRSQGLDLSGTEYSTIIGFGSIRYKIRYDHGIWIYLAQYFVRSCSPNSSGSVCVTWQSLVCAVSKLQTLKRNILTKQATVSL